MPIERRRLAYALLGAVVLHAAAVSVLALGLWEQPPAEVTVPVTLQATLDRMEAARPAAAPTPAPAAAKTPAAPARPVAATPQPVPAPKAAPAIRPTEPAAALPSSPSPTPAVVAPSPVQASAAAAATAGPSGATASAPSAARGGASPVAAGSQGQPTAAAPGQAVARVELPSANADYLNNPRPAYPPMSRRLGETGQVMVRVFIAVDGLPSQASVARSSGFDRLDQAAVATVLKWRFVPGKRAGVPEAMWFNVPINFVLE